MRRCALALVLVLGAQALSGCNEDGKQPAPTAPAIRAAAPAPSATTNSKPARTNAEVIYHLDHAQPKLKTVKLWIGPKELEAEMARTITQISTGLMFRSGIGTNESMLFVFPQPYQPAFYMKNVDFPIAAAYIDPEGVVQEIVQLKAREEKPVPSKSTNIQFVLETAPDWWERNGLGTGTLIRTDKLSLRENFLGR